MILEFSIALIGMLIVLLIVLSKSVYLVKQAETVIIERFGRYDRTLTAGIHLVVPFMEAPGLFIGRM